MGDIVNGVIKSIDGKYVTVKTTSNGKKLCVVDQQTKANVKIVTRSLSGKKQMALCFQHGDTDYVPMVAGNELKINKLDDSRVNTSLPDSHWFEKYNGKRAGEHYGLQSVVQPRKYLSIKSVDYSIKTSQRHYIMLSENSHDCILVTDQSQ